MSFPISSANFSNPLLKELLEVLSGYFESKDREFYIIGATARDIILSGIHNHVPERMTEDLDIAIAIQDWASFDTIAQGLCSLEDFTKSDKQKQRFFYKGYMLDILPFGKIVKADNNIYWPPDEVIAMSVVGFTEVAKEALTLKVDDKFSIRVASLAGIFILKMGAWRDRKNRTNKDADDMALIISEYLEINLERAVEQHFDIYDIPNFTTFVAGAILLGRDIRQILSGNQEVVNDFSQLIENEIGKEESSVLINQMLETHVGLAYEEVVEALRLIEEVLSTLTQGHF